MKERYMGGDNMASQIEIRVQRVEPLYEEYAEPTIRFVGDITNRSNDRVLLVYLNCEISLKDKGIVLGTVPLVIDNLSPNQQKELKISFSFSIDSNNVIHDLLKQQELEDVVFELNFSGFCLKHPTSGSQYLSNLNSVAINISQEIGLPVDKYRRLLSTYYRDIAWISVSRETYNKLKDLMNSEGATTLDELISKIIAEREKK